VGTSFPLRCKLASKVEEALKLEVGTPEFLGLKRESANFDLIKNPENEPIKIW
jgi:hypothetical protein